MDMDPNQHQSNSTSTASETGSSSNSNHSQNSSASYRHLTLTKCTSSKHLSFDDMLEILKGLLGQLEDLQKQAVDYNVGMAELLTDATMLLDPAVMRIVRKTREKQLALATAIANVDEEEADAENERSEEDMEL